MPRVTSAKRYAQAALELAQEGNELDEWQLSLKRIAELMSDAELMALLESPKIPFSLKKGLLEERLKGINPLALNLACLLVAKGNLKIADKIAAEYEHLLDAYRGIEHAEVTTAIPLDDEDKEKLSQHLEMIAGKKVIIETQVNPSIIGGIIARIDDKLLDGSVRSKLEILRESLAEAGR